MTVNLVPLDTTRELNIVFAPVAEIYDFREAETLAVGDVVYRNSNGKAAKAKADVAGTAQACGVVVSRIGTTVSVMKRGFLAGFDLSGLNPDAQAFVSAATAGALADGAGTVPVPVGRVHCLTNDSLTKVLYVDFDWVKKFA